jgi:hypothetical protein
MERRGFNPAGLVASQELRALKRVRVGKTARAVGTR